MPSRRPRIVYGDHGALGGNTQQTEDAVVNSLQKQFTLMPYNATSPNIISPIASLSSLK